MKTKGIGRKKPLVIKETDSEDWCFVCKEGGDVRICDYKDCLKSYHAHCVGKEDAFIDSKEPWKCKWHNCFVCKRSASFHCYSCPQAVCSKCISISEFVVVRRKSGFCAFCLHLLSMIAENRDADSDGETVDFEDLTTYEGLFMDYYNAELKKKNLFSLEDVRAAKDRFKKREFDLDDIYDGDGEDGESASDYEVEGEGTEDVGPKRKKDFKGQPPAKKAKNVKSKEMQFTGWGSSRLITFLESIGEDTTTELNELQVENRIKAYAKKEKLSDPKKKSSKMILCDAKLQSLFEMKALNKNKIGSLIKPHFANFVASEEEDEDEEDGEEEKWEKREKRIAYLENEDASVARKPRRKSKEEDDSPKAKSVCCTSESSFAAIVAENIKLVYLRKSLLQELSKDPEAFQEKVTGSFIRAKTDPNDYTQKLLYELLQVTGVKRSTSGDTSEELILLVSKMPAEIRLSSLSDADIQEEECAELRLKVKDGSIPKPTVAELQKKARSLHVDITKHWIARELKFLDQRIEFTNEKGRRQQLFEYLDQRKLLQTPAEQTRLLETFPAVKAEELEPVCKEMEQNTEVPSEPVPTNMVFTWGSNETSVAGSSRYPSKVPSQMWASASENQGSEKLDKEDRVSSFTTTSKLEKLEAGSTTEHTPPKVLEPEKLEKGMKTPPKERDPEEVMKTPSKTVVDEVIIVDEPVVGISSDDESATEHRLLETFSTVKAEELETVSEEKEQNTKGSEITPEPAPTELKCTSGGSKYPSKVSNPMRASASENQGNEKLYKDSFSSTSPELEKLAAGSTTDHTPPKVLEPKKPEIVMKTPSKTVVDEVNIVSLSSDDDEVDAEPRLEDLTSKVWLIVGPNGEQGDGKYSLSSLKKWSLECELALKYKAWRETESQEQAIPLGKLTRVQ